MNPVSAEELKQQGCQCVKSVLAHFVLAAEVSDTLEESRQIFMRQSCLESLNEKNKVRCLLTESSDITTLPAKLLAKTILSLNHRLHRGQLVLK